MNDKLTGKNISKHYDQLSPVYEERWSIYNETQRNWIMENLPQEPPDSIIELGCGQGLMLEKLAFQYPDAAITGVDASQGMLSRVPDTLKSRSRFVKGNLEDKTLQNSLPQTDLVLSLSVLHHLKDPLGHLRTIKSIVRDGGTVFISAFARDGFLMNAANLWFGLTQSIHHTTWSNDEMYSYLSHIFPQARIHSRILRPDRFWRIQIFSIEC